MEIKKMITHKKLKEILVKIANDGQSYSRILDIVPSHVATDMENFVGGYEPDMEAIKDSLSTVEFQILKRVNHDVMTRNFDEFDITSDVVKDYIQSVIEGDIKPEDIEIPFDDNE